MQYYWIKNKTAEIWFRNKNKPPQNHRLSEAELAYVPIYFTFGRESLRHTGEEIPSAECFMLLRITKAYDYVVKGNFYLNSKDFFGIHPRYNFENNIMEDQHGISFVYRVEFNCYSKSYDVKFVGGTENAKPNMNRHNIDKYLNSLQNLPEIAEEIFRVVPKIKRKKQ